jgi:hypothetical protein
MDMISNELALKMVALMPDWMAYEKNELLTTGKISRRGFYYLLDESSALSPHELEIVRQNVQRSYSRGPNPPIKINPELMARLLKKLLLLEGLE